MSRGMTTEDRGVGSESGNPRYRSLRETLGVSGTSGSGRVGRLTWEKGDFVCL